jgi:CBS domain-containing protein
MSADASDPIAKYQAPISQDLATKPISNFMTEKVITASPRTTVKTAMQMMIQNEISGLPIVDAQNRCVGIYSEFDALLQGASGPLDVPIRFSPKVSSLKPNAHYKDGLLLLAKTKFKRIPIIDSKGMLVGVLSRSDLLKALFEDQKP